ncbi:transcription termination/antitermination protein NusG [Methylocella sp.]|uniref:transcription termination/antitermination protein NusG n=1 Tax=Methylocella sp. TaxID=1978226 RepID=UPI0035AD7B28
MSEATIWYVAYTAAKAERRAAKALERVGFKTFAPVMRVTRQRRGRRFSADRLVFPRYLFVGMAPVCTWLAFREADGVLAVLSNDDRPLPVEASIIEGLRAAMAGGAFALRETEAIGPGSKVRIASGAFAGFEGVCTSALGDRRIEVVVKLFNQPTIVKIPLDGLINIGPSSATGHRSSPYRIDIGPARATGSRKAS